MNEAYEQIVTDEISLPTEDSLPVEDSLPTEDSLPVEEIVIESHEASEEPLREEASCETLPTEDESARLREEVSLLRRRLEETKEAHARQVEELAEFQLLFPNVSLKEIPEEVRKQVDEGIPLCAAYALYEKKVLAAEQRARQINKRNASLSAGKAGMDAGEEYFSPDEVRAMSLRQVRENYTRIKESMKSWI